jgi:hypothetical protein
MAAGRSAPARSHRRRGHRRGWTGLARPSGPRVLFGSGCARWAGAEYGQRRGGAAATMACWRSWRGAGEHGQPRRTRAPGRGNGAIPVPKLAEDVAEEACRR